MEKYQVHQIHNVLNFDLNKLVEQSKEDGFRFVERLMTDYKSGTNTFNQSGEYLFGVFNDEGVLIAIGGLNNDPYTIDQCIGRMRRFYVSKEYRRHGVGSLLAQKLIAEAKKHYKILVLHTDTEQGNDFYTSLGFSKDSCFPKSSHYMKL